MPSDLIYLGDQNLHGFPKRDRTYKPMKMLFFLQPGKRKAMKMMRLWSEGAARAKVTCVVDERLGNPRSGYTPVFYGVAESTLRVFNQSVRAGSSWLYIDNQYFKTRLGKMYRVTWNALQHTGVGESDGKRLLKVFSGRVPSMRKWHTDGRHILITLQSELYFQLLMPYTRSEWLNKVVRTLRLYTDRPIIVREKPHPSRPYAQTIPFERHLIGCYAIVTLNSATAIEGIMRGIPCFVTDQHCAIVPSANTTLSEIEDPKFFDREAWLALLAENQWSSKELENGEAINALSRRKAQRKVPGDLVQRAYKLDDIR